MELVGHATTQQSHDDPRRLIRVDLIGDPGFFGWHGQRQPLIQACSISRRKAVGFIDQHQGVACDMGQSKAVVIAAGLGFELDLGLQARGGTHPHEELIIAASLP